MALFFSFFALQERPKNGPGDYDNNRRGNWCSYCKFYLALWFFSFEMFEFYMDCFHLFVWNVFLWFVLCIIIHSSIKIQGFQYRLVTSTLLPPARPHAAVCLACEQALLFGLFLTALSWAQLPITPSATAHK